MQRVAEPELMLDAEQALAYATADFEEPNRRFIELISARAPAGLLARRGDALDLGCGPGDIALRFARRHPDWQIDALDGSPAMLALGREAAERVGLAARVRFSETTLPAARAPRAGYDLILSNSLLHHLRDPAALWGCAARWGKPGAFLLVMDLLRPEDDHAVERLVERYAGEEPEVLRRDFANSLRAAYTPDEVRAQLAAAGLERLELEVVSDRHFAVCGSLP